MTAQQMTDEEATALAMQIYTEVYGVDHKDFADQKTTEIRDWLIEGDVDEPASVENLAAEWREYDVEPEPVDV